MIAEECNRNGHGFGKWQVTASHAVTFKIPMITSKKMDVDVDVPAGKILFSFTLSLCFPVLPYIPAVPSRLTELHPTLQ